MYQLPLDKNLYLTRLHNDCYNVGVMIKQLLRNKQSQTVFTVSDIALYLDKEVDSNLVSNIHYYVRKGELIQLSKGLYALDMDYNKFELGNKVRRPSYLSFYTVLQLNGVIFQPYDTIFYASNRSEVVNMDQQQFKYRKLKDEILLNSLGIEGLNQYSIASVERALCDKLYLDGIEYFDNLSKIDWEFVGKLIDQVYKSDKMKLIVKKLKDA